MYEIRCKRVYEAAEDEDGVRILADRLWPRGISKEKLKAEEWCKDIAPSGDLRKWFGHDPEKYEEFCRRYYNELAHNEGAENFRRRCAEWLKAQNVTLLYSAKDTEHNNAEALKKWLCT